MNHLRMLLDARTLRRACRHHRPARADELPERPHRCEHLHVPAVRPVAAMAFLARQIPLMNAGVEWNRDEIARLVNLLWPSLTEEVRKRGAVKPAPRRNPMIASIRKYAKGIVAGIGYAASIATALGLTHYHWVAIILGLLSTYGVIKVRNTASAAAPARPAAR